MEIEKFITHTFWRKNMSSLEGPHGMVGDGKEEGIKAVQREREAEPWAQAFISVHMWVQCFGVPGLKK